MRLALQDCLGLGHLEVIMFYGYRLQPLFAYFLLLSIGVQATEPENANTDIPRSGIPYHLTRIFPGKSLFVPAWFKNVKLLAAPINSQYNTETRTIFEKTISFLRNNVCASSNFFTDSKVKEKSKFDVIRELFWTRNYIRAEKIRAKEDGKTLTGAHKRKLTWKEYLEYVHAVLTVLDKPELEFLKSYRPASLEDGVLDGISKFEPITKERAEALHQLIDRGIDPHENYFDPDSLSFYEYLKQYSVLSEYEFRVKFHQTSWMGVRALKAEDYKKYTVWFIIRHIGIGGLGFLQDCTVNEEVDFAGAGAWMQMKLLYARQPKFSVEYSRKISNASLMQNLQGCGHEVAGHFRDYVVACIIDRAIARFAGLSDFYTTRRMLEEGVDAREEEYNADVQGFVLIENTWDSWDCLCSLIKNGARQSVPYTDFRTIAKNIQLVIQKKYIADRYSPYSMRDDQ